ncbi:hypothetical protein NMK71_04940 [Weeksellaceae bacterium KMM 9713]|uniref:Tetratricopeptide repeat-containing protein n=1 Tax=Profundicola chukchiensis TaxID=2961959 RepID=A0A9X4MZE1_9FLAO|nr:hypothetical protein [Profundicola chukchiensis]MDG4945752.1 hypothetical protein [Profundicola chukchiensis]
MSFKEITELRKSGKLEEALTLSNEELAKDPNNIWNKRAASWVYYEYLKKYDKAETYDSFMEYLNKLKDLNLLEEDKMVFDQCAWKISSLIFDIVRDNPLDSSKLTEVFNIIKDFHFSKPSDSYSLLHKAFVKNHKNWSNYLSFADWWGFENFRSEDFQKEEFNGKQIMSLAEKAYIAYSKKLLEGEAMDAFGNERKLDLDKIEAFIPELNSIIAKHQDYQYPTYYRTQLLLVLGKKDKALKSFLPFVKQKKNDFWVWQLLAEIFKDDKDLQLSCYCKALSLRTNEDFIVSLREDFADLLIELKLFKEAKTEIKQAMATRLKHEWKMSHRLNQWSNEDWYKETQENANNKEFYQKNLIKAEQILFQDIPEEIIVVEYVNQDKNILNFIKNKDKTGFFNYSGLNINPTIGNILKVRFDQNSEGDFYRVLTAEIAENESSEALRSYMGEIRLHEKGFGFADDVFFSKNFIDDNKIEHGQIIQGTAILSFNKSKEEWGWKALDLNK